MRGVIGVHPARLPPHKNGGKIPKRQSEKNIKIFHTISLEIEAQLTQSLKTTLPTTWTTNCFIARLIEFKIWDKCMFDESGFDTDHKSRLYILVKQNRQFAKSTFRVSRIFGIPVVALANIPYIGSNTDIVGLLCS